MSNESQNKSNDTLRETLNKAIMAIQSAMQLLQEIGDSTTDETISENIVSVYNRLDSFLTQLSQAQATTDDAIFTKITGELKQQATALRAEEDKIKKIVGYVGKAAQIVGYIAQAVAFIAKLP
jgi:hypothetical protein